MAKKYDGSHARSPGRPRTKPELASLVVRMATENPTWGYTRIRGGLKHLGHNVARHTIEAIVVRQNAARPIPGAVAAEASPGYAALWSRGSSMSFGC